MPRSILELRNITLLLGILLLVITCGGNVPQTDHTGSQAADEFKLDIALFGEGTEIIAAGQLLMEQPMGVTELTVDALENDSVLVMAVHGYDSRGYEWITGLKNLAEHYGSAYFYRYDWNQCPDEIAAGLASEVKRLARSNNYQKIVLFGHSYGGMVLTFVASELGKLDADLHVIAAPLSGFPRLLDRCTTLSYDSGDKLTYPEWNRSVRLIQHRTVHAQDGAFRELAIDPQDIDLPFIEVFQLPPTMDGHRLGHNWSVTWVLDKYVGKAHRL